MNGALKIIGFGLAALVAAGAYTVARQRVEEKHTVQAFLDSIATMKQQQHTQEAALQARFNQIDVDQYMQASKLASSSGVADGRVELARYRALLVERDQLVVTELAQSHALLNSLPEGRLREQALRGAANGEGRNSQLRSTLDHAQVANADAVQAVFDWADRNHAIVHVRGNQLVINGQAPLDELNSLEAHVRETGQAVNESLGRIGTVQSQSARTLDQLRHDAAE